MLLRPYFLKPWGYLTFHPGGVAYTRATKPEPQTFCNLRILQS